MIFINELIDRSPTDQYDWFHNNQIMQSTWQTGVANARLQFSEEARFRILAENGCQETLNILSVSNWNHWSQIDLIRQNITLSNRWPPTNMPFRSLDWSLTFANSGIGKNEKSPLHSLSPILSKLKSTICYIWQNCKVCSSLDHYYQNTRDFRKPSPHWTCSLQQKTFVWVGGW